MPTIMIAGAYWEHTGLVLIGASIAVLIFAVGWLLASPVPPGDSQSDPKQPD